MDDQGTAAGMLQQARRVQQRVLRQGPRDWLVQAGWALWVLVFIPPFDLLSASVWGPVVLVSSASGTALTMRYYSTRLRRVRPLGPRPRWLWPVWSLWYLGWVIFAKVSSPQLDVAWTLAAVAAAVPLLAYAGRARRRSQPL
jgi:hypothetical protein